MPVTIFGLTFGDNGSGYSSASYAAIRAAIADRWKKLRNLPGMNTAPGSFYGDMTDIAASVLDAAQQTFLSAVSQALFMQAAGVWLDLLLSPVTIRLAATSSTVKVYAYGNAGAFVPINSIVRSSPTAPPFVFGAGITVPAPAAAEAWVWEIEAFGAGEQNGTTFTLIVDITPFIVTAGPLDTSETIRDSLVSAVNGAALTQLAYAAGTLPNAEPTRWAGLVREESGSGPFPVVFTSTGPPTLTSLYTAAADTCTASVTGPQQAGAQSLRFGTTFAGIVGYVNVDAATPGRNQETDAQMRARHIHTQRQGGGNPDAIRAIVLMPAEFGGGGANYCTVEYNPTDVVVDDNQPHSIRVVIDPATFASSPTRVAQIVWTYKAAGDQTNGTPFPVVDSEGGAHVIRIDKLTEIYCWIDIEVTPGEGWPANGNPLEQLRSDVVAWVQTLGGGHDVRPNDAPVSLYPDGTPRGISNFRIRIGSSTDPAGILPPIGYLDYWPDPEPVATLASVIITGRQIAVTSLARVSAVIV